MKYILILTIVLLSCKWEGDYNHEPHRNSTTIFKITETSINESLKDFCYYKVKPLDTTELNCNYSYISDKIGIYNVGDTVWFTKK